MSPNITWGIIAVLAFALGLGLRFKNDRVFNKFVDPILFFQGIFVVGRLLNIPSVWLSSYLLSLVLAIVLILLNRKKDFLDRIVLTASLVPLLIVLLANLEHYSWARFASCFLIASSVSLVYLVLYRTKSIKKELPYLVLFILSTLIQAGTSIIGYF